MSDFTVQRVWRDYKGSVTSAAMTIGATSVAVENIVDFDEDGGDFVLGADSGTYTGITESDTDETAGTVVGLSPAVTVAHPKGTFLYEGTKARGPKRCDGFLDGDDSLVEGVLIPSHLRRLFRTGKRVEDEMEVVGVAFDEDGVPYITDGPEDEEVGEIQWFQFTIQGGDLELGVRDIRWEAPFTGTAEVAYVTMGNGGAPTGSSAIIEVLLGGSTFITLTIPASALSSGVQTPNESFNIGNVFEFEVTQIGSTLPGSSPVITLGLRPRG